MRPRQTACFLAAIALLAGACSGSDDADDPGADEPAGPHDDAPVVWPGESDAEHTVELGAGLVADLPDTWVVTPFEVTDDCETARAGLATGSGSLALALPPAGCTDRVGIGQIGNGYHGEYLSIDEVTEPRSVEEHDVAAGSLVTFMQLYYECTNECDNYDDHVALLSLDAPVDPDRPTVMLLDAKGALPMDGLVAVAEAIRAG